MLIYARKLWLRAATVFTVPVRAFSTRLRQNARGNLLAELAIILIWALFVGKNLLQFSTNLVPDGGEFSSLIQSNFIWTLIPRCGLCFLWNGFLKGGAPALVDTSAPILHPFVFIPVLLFGVVNGAKVTIIASLALAGMAQWGLAYKLKLGFAARMWSSLLVVAGGHLAGKLENGNLGLMLGLACAALVLMYGVDLLFNRNRKALVGLAVATALTILSGEGYIQVALVLTLLPMLGLFLINQLKEDKPAWKDLVTAVGIAVLLAGIFLVPLIHFSPYIYKDGDETLGNFPPIEYAVFNLVIHDMQFFQTEILGKDPYPYTHILYIGWAPVLLALMAFKFADGRLKQILWVFFTGIILVFLVTTADLPRLLLNSLPVITKLRHLPVTTGMVVPLIVTLAAVSVDHILKSPALKFTLSSSHSPLIGGYVEQVLLIPVLALSLLPVYNFSQGFFGVHDVGMLSTELENLKTSSAQWVSPPYNHYDWITVTFGQGLKIANIWRPWGWKDHEDPKPMIETIFLPEQQPERPPDKKTEYYAYFQTGADPYAFAQDTKTQTKIPCRAVSQGGSIDVTCPAEAKGILTVQENNFSGWQVWANGKKADLLPSRWLEVDMQEGIQVYQFRYYPWDVPLGLVVTLLGVFLAVQFYRRSCL